MSHASQRILASLVLLAASGTGCTSIPATRASPLPKSPVPVEYNTPSADQSAGATVPTSDEAAADFMDRFPMSRCPLCDSYLGARGEAVEIVHSGRQIRLCCDSCRLAFERDPYQALARVDSVLVADQMPHYPLKTSLFDVRPLPERPIDFIWGNRLFRAVDTADRDRILANPVTAIRRLDQAVIEAQRPTYGMPDKCPVQGDILPNEARIDIVVANRMIRVCCGRCVKVVKARPYQYLAMVEFANRERALRMDADPEEESR
ncbi:MAG: hypothetical protein IPK69_02605 [Phycisphaerales bacterium]|nr:MAG: hypothetical protein IPK69_02605 [Phycisphaerales bacterium]